ncbi:GIY-YIG nuclease family protein [Nocardia sp. NPDC047648]|uniref:GIY-YIG nuclease family protein n=1 Tax=Nocardia sp. NPDC047648 TaxID=3155625 RepID=UPI0033D79733
MTSEEPYQYRGLPLTPNILAENILRTHEPGAVIRTRDLVQSAMRYHIEHGGSNSQSNLKAQGKKALVTLESQRKIERTGGYGLWRILGSAADDARPAVTDDDLAEEIEETFLDELPYEAVLGTGSESIYAYYFPTYRKLAEATGESIWPIKVGRTSGDVASRVLSQVGTALPEIPIIALVYRTEHSVSVEAMIHGVFVMRGRKVDAPGAEWFSTSPDELIDLILWAEGEEAAQSGPWMQRRGYLVSERESNSEQGV